MTQTLEAGRRIVAVSPPLRPMGGGMDGRLVIGQGSGLDALDPFPALMHDDVPPHIMFPLHPHRGVEIISYCLTGALYHEDTLGNAGTLVPGGVERNLFGRGFEHSERPLGDEHYRGFQLFIALSPADRQLAPSWQVLAPSEVPEVTRDGVTVRVIAGEYRGTHSPLVLRNPTLYLDVQLAPGRSVTLPLPADYAGIAYVLSGQGRFGTPAVEAGPYQRLVLGEGSDLRVEAAGAEDAERAGSPAAGSSAGEPLRFVLISGRPIFPAAP
jgi:redox-sensitive bicupin YhaK (pirin superfamily)